jgi:hypothetical protein
VGRYRPVNRTVEAACAPSPIGRLAAGNIVDLLADFVSYSALRVCPRAAASDWWAAVRLRQDAPAAIAALARGRSRVELTADDAVTALAWAGATEGWGSAEPKPLFIHRPKAFD